LVQQSTPLDVQIGHTDITCAGASDGTASATSSGNGPLVFTWSNGSTGASIQGLDAGSYSVEVVDALGCQGTASVTIDEPVPFTLSTPGVLSMCAGSSMDLEVTPSGGTAPFDLTYDPGGPIVSPIITTNYTVEGVDAHGCTATAEVLVEVGGPLMPEFSISDPEGCAPHCITLITTSNGTFEWDLGDGIVVAGNEVQHCYDEGSYEVSLTITDDVGCSATADADTLITVHPSPNASFVADPPVTTIEQPQVQLIPQAGVDAELFWSIDGEPLDPQEFSPSVILGEVDCYRIALEVLSGNGCTANEEIELCIEEAFQVFAPNAFTPNNDGINDGFQVITSVRDPEYYELRLHDRWGRAIHIITDPNSAWNAQDIPTGVYIWMLRMRDTLGAIQERSGHVSVIR
jgi:gliding motility-associated-like protein